MVSPVTKKQFNAIITSIYDVRIFKLTNLFGVNDAGFSRRVRVGEENLSQIFISQTVDI